MYKFKNKNILKFKKTKNKNKNHFHPLKKNCYQMYCLNITLTLVFQNCLAAEKISVKKKYLRNKIISF